MIDHPDRVDLDTSKDLIFESLMKDSSLMTFNSNLDQVGSVGDDSKRATIPYIITKYLPSHQSLNGQIIIEICPKFLTPK